MFKTVRTTGAIPSVGIARKFELSQKAQHVFVKKFFEALDSPVSLACWLQYEAGEVDDLVSRELRQCDYADEKQFKDDFAAISFLRKSEFLRTSIDRESAALEKFRDAELACRTTNKRLWNLIGDPSYTGANVALLHAMTRKIEVILGAFDVAEFFDSGSFGPGSSAIIKEDTSAVRKFREEHSITSSLYQLVEPCLESAYPVWFREGKISKPRFVEFSKVMTVPKNAKIDRVIAIEPGLNIWFQKAIGRMIKKRLSRNGLNLKGSKWVYALTSKFRGLRHYAAQLLEESQKINGTKARYGSQGLGLSTVDFSSASDMIAYELCRLVLPPMWFDVMRLCRTARYQMPGQKESEVFHKFSSMGNGFTFELESLIFYTAALSCCEADAPTQMGEVSVFGDDVVIPTAAFGSFVKFTTFLGFKVNQSKSFCDGNFRESCGEFYFDGTDVKPLFYKKRLSSTFEVYNMMNRIRTLSHHRGLIPGCDKRFEKVWTFLKYCLPKELRVFGTKEGGQGCIWANFDQVLPTLQRNTHRKERWIDSEGVVTMKRVLCVQEEGFSFPCYTFPAVMLDADCGGLLTARYFTTSALNGAGNSYTIRGLTGVRKSRITVQQWYDFGPWY